ncbi:MAG TPA: helix-turn-helix transcriptional regulator [Chitinophagales bacterium]|nr:helix-turn-helix transcriptional regulator [Chitinophagales bacterium]
MVIAERIQKIRELSGWKQAAVASTLNITQQAYGNFEKNGDSAKLETLQKFCTAMNVNLSFLLEMDVPVTDESLREYGRTGFGNITRQYHALAQRMEALQDLIAEKGY